jgi:xanthine/uracil permease
MLGGIVSVPLIVGGPFDAKLSSEEVEYLISAGLISSGILSLVQIYRFKLGESGYYMGTGLVSVLGTSFTFVPIARTSIGFMMAEDSGNACKTDADCTMAWASFGVATPGVTNKG